MTALADHLLHSWGKVNQAQILYWGPRIWFGFSALIGLFIFNHWFLTALYFFTVWLLGTKSLSKGVYFAILLLSMILLGFILLPCTYPQLVQIMFYIPLLLAVTVRDRISPLLSALVITVVLMEQLKGVGMMEVISSSVDILIFTVLVTYTVQLVLWLVGERTQLLQMNQLDALTGLYNLDHAATRAQTLLDVGKPIAVAVLDLDNFKIINDTYGHLTGNQVLIQVADFLRNTIPSRDSFVARLGGDEFLVVTSDPTWVQNPGLLEQTIPNHTEINIEADRELGFITITFSIGFAYSGQQKEPCMIQQLIHAADTRMLFNKYQNEIPGGKLQLQNETVPDHFQHILSVLAEKDMYTYVHSLHVAEYATALGKALRLSREMLENLQLAGLLHDVGKLMVSNQVLRKQGDLTDDEYKLQIKPHVKYSMDILSSLHIPAATGRAIHYHHERWDGRGYPYGMEGTNTPLEARILQIADAFSAMTIKRVYRSTMSREEALQELYRCSGTQFDPNLTNLFGAVMTGICRTRDNSQVIISPYPYREDRVAFSEVPSPVH